MRKKLKSKKYVLGLVGIIIILLLYFYVFRKDIKPNKTLYNVTSGERIDFIKNPDDYDEDNIMKLLDKKTFELSSDKNEDAYCKIVFTSGEGDFDGEFLDQKDKTKIYSNFKGKLEPIKKLDKLTYKIEVSKIDLKDSGFSNDKKDQDLVYVFPNHFREKNQFILRFPNTKIYSLIDGYEKYDFQNIVTDTLNVFTLETGGYVYYEKVN